jgi:hypothetical protein
MEGRGSHQGMRPWNFTTWPNDIGESRNFAKQKPDLVAKAQRYLKAAHTDMRPQIEPPHEPGKVFDV